MHTRPMRRLLTATLSLTLLGAAQAQSTLTANVTQKFGTLDPAKISDITQYMAAINLYDGLLGINTNDVLTAGIASKWNVSKDGRTYTFTIQPGIRFHSGNPVTAADVVYSMKRVLAINQGPAFLWNDVLNPANVTSSGNTVKMVLNKPFSPFLNTMPLLFVVDSKTVQARESGKDAAQAWLTSNEAGSGPFRLGSFQDGKQLTLTRNKAYFGGFPAGAYDQVNIVVNADDTSLEGLARSGQLGMTSQFQGQALYDTLSKMPGWRVNTSDSRMLLYLKMNNGRAPFDDVNVRKAVASAIDYTSVRMLYPSSAPRGVLAPSFSVHNRDIPTLRQDMNAARGYLAKSKYAGQRLNVELVYVDGLEFQKKIGEQVRKDLLLLGINVTLKPKSWSDIVAGATRVETTPQMTEIFFVPTYPSANSVFYTQYHSQAPRGWAASTWLKDPEVDRLIDQALSSTDMNVIRQRYVQLQQKLFDLMPDIPLALQQTQFGMRREVQGYQTSPVQAFDLNFRNFYRKP